MTSPDSTTLPSAGRPRTGLATSLNLVGAVVIAYWVVAIHWGDTQHLALVLVVSFLALVAWAARAFLRGDRLQDIAGAVMLLGGSIMVVPTESLLVTPAIVAVAAFTAQVRHRLAVGVVATLVGAGIVVATVVVDGSALSFLLGTLAGFALGLAVGFSRRQNNLSALREQELARRALEVEREQERNALLADRATIARDIHDLLAHSLGGLVIQLDAVEALLEAGRIDEAAARVGAARTLAAEGLGEARRAVATLRDPDGIGRASGAGGGGAATGGAADTLSAPDALERLLAAHESLGGAMVVTGTDALATLDAPHRRAALAVVRESLSNARRHAPGEIVTLAVSGADPRLLTLSLSNAVQGRAVTSTEGHGVRGMGERLDELGDASRLTAGRQGDRWVVTAEVER